MARWSERLPGASTTAATTARSGGSRPRMVFVRYLALLALGLVLPAAAQEPAPTPRQVLRDDLQTAIIQDAAELIGAMEVDFDFHEGRTRGRTHESPLTLAVRRGRPEIVKMLLERGADVHRK